MSLTFNACGRDFKEMSALGDADRNRFLDGGSIPPDSTKRVLDEHLLL